MSPQLRLVRGVASAEELAALTASILAVVAPVPAAPRRTMPPQDPPASAWLGRAKGWRPGLIQSGL
jgi:hypothetical protein